MWLAAVGARVAYVVHRTCGHAVVWKASPPDLTCCTGDIVCYDCGQVLWCRADDPWRPRTRQNRHLEPSRSPFEHLQQVLRLAEQCPPGPAGDDIRRAACELIEAESSAARITGRRRILKAINAVEQRRLRGRSRDDDPSESTVRKLIDALRRELRPSPVMRRSLE